MASISLQRCGDIRQHASQILCRAKCNTASQFIEFARDKGYYFWIERAQVEFPGSHLLWFFAASFGKAVHNAWQIGRRAVCSGAGSLDCNQIADLRSVPSRKRFSRRRSAMDSDVYCLSRVECRSNRSVKSLRIEVCPYCNLEKGSAHGYCNKVRCYHCCLRRRANAIPERWCE
jgi:hypothetical protein